MAGAVFFLFLGAVIGGVALLVIEFLLTPFSLYYWFCCRRTKPAAPLNPNKACDPDGKRSLPFTCSKEGTVWVLEPAKVPYICTKESPAKGAKEQMNEKEITKVYPVEKHAKIKDCALILSDHDGSQVFIKLLDCVVTTVSASDKSSQKWDKTYPIKLESKSCSLIYNGSKICYIYLNTSRDKESWCKALRLASYLDKERINSYARLSEDFQYYLAFLPFLKPSTMIGSEAIEKANKVHRSKKIRSLLKGFVKMTTSKNGSVSSSSHHEKGKPSDKLPLPPDGIVKATPSEKSSSNSLQDQQAQPPLATTQYLGSSKIPLFPDHIISDSACNEKFITDEATLCWNLLFSRLFFDIKRNSKVNGFIKSRIQSALSDMRAPSYVGRMQCTALDLGNLPPYIHQMRVLSMDISAIWAVEVDIEYLGGMTFDIEMKYEDQEPKLQEGIADDSSSGMDMITYVLEDGLEQSKSTGWASTCMSKWKKTVQHSIVDHVSHVPLSLTMRIASLRGTLQLHIKPPPSDQLWFGFTSMPEIDWNLDPEIRDQKTSCSSEIALLLKDYFKDTIREFLVVPNFECVCIPWMFDEKDDWVPLKVAPFKWVHQGEGRDIGDLDASNSQSEENENKPVDDINGNKANTSACHESPSHESLLDFEASQTSPCISVSSDRLSSHTNMLEVETPQSRETQECSGQSRVLASPMITSREMVILEGHKTVHFEVDPKPRKISRKLQMKEMGKIVGNKIEEKRRHIGEKGKYIVEKMRETTRT